MSHETTSHPMPRIGDIAPDFTAETTDGTVAQRWTDGDDVIIVPALRDDDARDKFPGGWDEQKPYLRVLPQPS